MRLKTPKWLEDIRVACEFIINEIAGKTLADYKSNQRLRFIVERNFEIIGEAIGRIARFDPDTASRIGDYPRIIAFRNVLIHGYDLVDHTTVWEVIHEHLPGLKKRVEELLKEAENDLPSPDSENP
jgi:uncharacterized protein with HEPN domain